MTFRIVLVDDEKAVTDWLQYLLSSTLGETADIYRFNESVQAMKFMENNPFDIAILDINMPAADGMAMLDFICEKRPDARVIFLTGYDQFEFVRKAVNHQVTAYVLKNEEDDVLLNAVRTAMRQVEEGCHKQHLLELAKRRLEAAGPLLRREYLIRLLQEPNCSRLGFPVCLHIDEAAPFCLLYCLAGAPSNRPADIGTVFAAGLAMEEELAKCFIFESVMPDESGWLWLLQHSDGMGWSLESDTSLRQAIEAAQLRFSRQTGGNLCFLHTSRPIFLKDLSRAYMSLRPLRALAPEGAHAVLTEADLADAANAETAGAPSARYESATQSAPALQLLLDQGKRDEFFHLLDRMTIPMQRLENPVEPYAEEAFMAVSSVLLSYINRMRLLDRMPRDLPLQKLYSSGLHSSRENAMNFFREIAAVLFDQQDCRRESRSMAYVQKASKYISEHLNEDLSLISVADRVMLNPSYFSMLFKSASGINLSDYIKSERIKKAKDLLRDKKYRINEISRMIGYANPAYFTRFFKNETGQAPFEYRNQMDGM